MNNPNIIRNRLKIEAAVTNARAFLKVQEEYGSFDRFIWGYVGHKPIKNVFHTPEEVPAKTEISEKMSKDLVQRGFKFVGPTICYAYMQSVGMVNDHMIWCCEYERC